MNGIVLQKINKQFSTKVSVLNDIDQTFESGKFYAIVGESGAGKTTLLQIMGTLESPSNGQIWINERSIAQMNSKDKAKLRNQEIGFVFQSFFLHAGLTALENVMIPMLITDASLAKCADRAQFILTQLGLSERLDHLPNQLSGGEQQRVAIARALINHPHIILADEPTGNLDIKNEKILLELFQSLAAQGMLVVMVTHSPTVLSYADQVLLLQEGNLSEIGGDHYA